MKQIRPINKKSKNLFILGNLLFIIISLISPFLVLVLDPTTNFTNNVFNSYNLFLYGGIYGVLLIFSANILLNRKRIRLSITAMIVGYILSLISISIIIMYLIALTPVRYDLGIGGYLYIISFLDYSVLIVRLLKYREPSELIKDIEPKTVISVSIISILYLIFGIIYFLLLLPMLIWYSFSQNLFIVLCYIGLISFLISLLLLIYTFRISLAISFAIIGFISILIFEIPINNLADISSQIRFFMLIIVLILNLMLYRFRALNPTPLTERIIMIKESNLYDIVKRKEMPGDDKFNKVKEKTVHVTEKSIQASEKSIEKIQIINDSPKKKVKSNNLISIEEVERRLTPEELEEKRKTESEVGVNKKEFVCVVHKGAIDGPIYLCPNCHTLYCQKCATALKEKDEKCWSCESEINI